MLRIKTITASILTWGLLAIPARAQVPTGVNSDTEKVPEGCRIDPISNKLQCPPNIRRYPEHGSSRNTAKKSAPQNNSASQDADTLNHSLTELDHKGFFSHFFTYGEITGGRGDGEPGTGNQYGVNIGLFDSKRIKIEASPFNRVHMRGQFATVDSVPGDPGNPDTPPLSAVNVADSKSYYERFGAVYFPIPLGKKLERHFEIAPGIRLGRFVSPKQVSVHTTLRDPQGNILQDLGTALQPTNEPNHFAGDFGYKVTYTPVSSKPWYITHEYGLATDGSQGYHYWDIGVGYSDIGGLLKKAFTRKHE